LRNNVDAILVIANEQIKNQYGNMALRKAFSTADQVIATAIDGISSAVLRSVQVNTDMADMRTTLERSGDMMMGVGLAEGPDRAILAVRDALDSPLFIEHDMHQAQRIIVSYSYSDPQYEISMDEMSIVNEELESKLGLPDQIWGITIDPTLGEALRITLVVAGLEAVPDDKLREISMGNSIKSEQAMAQGGGGGGGRNKHSPDRHNLPTRV
jgi:cell division protein FtsZ